MTLDAERLRNRASGFDFTYMPLAVANGQRIQTKPFFEGNGRRGVGVESPAEEHHRRHSCVVIPDSCLVGHRQVEITNRSSQIATRYTPRVAGSQMYLCSCSCTRTGRLSCSTHSESVRGCITS